MTAERFDQQMRDTPELMPTKTAVIDRRYSILRNPWLYLAISAVCTTISELFMKRGATDTAHISEQWSWTGLTTLGSPLVWIGIVFVVISFVTWLYVLKHMPLSVAFPASQVIHALIPLSSWMVLGERISLTRWCGIALVLLGLAIVARPVARLEEKL